ncbi:hypothetical protein SDC9_127930 [bioreactor metagenome]|uniref:Uncharacterized protein n=1 Tax=bioreactor metagenome TaxID=1076179 RepID=A0A645CVG1_9ZZZZ
MRRKFSDSGKENTVFSGACPNRQNTASRNTEAAVRSTSLVHHQMMVSISAARIMAWFCVVPRGRSSAMSTGKTALPAIWTAFFTTYLHRLKLAFSAAALPGGVVLRLKLQPHFFVTENPAVHLLKLRGDQGLKLHLLQNVLLQIHAGRNLGEQQALGSQLEDRPLGEIGDILPALLGVIAREGNLLHRLAELFAFTLLQDDKLAVPHLFLQPAGGEGAHKEHLLGVLGNVHKAARSGAAGPEFGDVHVAGFVNLRRPQEGHIQHTAVVHIQHIGNRINRFGVYRSAKAGAVHRNTALRPGLQREGDFIPEALLIGDVAHARGHADAQIDKVAGLQLHDSAAGNDFAVVQGEGRNRADGAAKQSAQLGAGPGRIALQMETGVGGLHHIIHHGVMDAH